MPNFSTLIRLTHALVIFNTLTAAATVLEGFRSKNLILLLRRYLGGWARFNFESDVARNLDLPNVSEDGCLFETFFLKMEPSLFRTPVGQDIVVVKNTFRGVFTLTFV